MSKRVNNWTRWHPRSPLLPLETEGDLEWAMSLGIRAKPFHNRDASHLRDIVHQRERAIAVAVTVFKCISCNLLYPSRGTLRVHIQKEHLFGRKAAEVLARQAVEVDDKVLLKDVDIYYEIVRPRKILPVPRSVEVDLLSPLDKGTRPPTIQEREIHDRQMARWRKDMKTKSRPDTLERLPNGLFNDPGLSGNWLYYGPNVWRQEAKEGKGAWLEPTEHECLKWSKLTLPKRVLILLGVVADR